jgi:hypothetical protein
MRNIEQNPNYQAVFFTINVQIGINSRIFKVGQQFKWSYRFYTKTCDCGDGFWTYMLEEQINGCKLDNQIPMPDTYGAQDDEERVWIVNSHQEDMENVGKDIDNQPHQKTDSPLWYNANGYLTGQGI